MTVPEHAEMFAKACGGDRAKAAQVLRGLLQMNLKASSPGAKESQMSAVILELEK